MKKKEDERPELPPVQQKVLDFVSEFIDISGYPPTISEIGLALDMASTFGVRKHLEALEKKGYIAREVGLSRAIRIL